MVPAVSPSPVIVYFVLFFPATQCYCLLAECGMYISKQWQLSVSAVIYLQYYKFKFMDFSSLSKYIKCILSKIHANDTKVLLNGQIHLQNIACSIREKQTPKPLLSFQKKNVAGRFAVNAPSLCVLSSNSGRLHLWLCSSSRNRSDKMHKLWLCVISRGKTLKLLRCQIFALETS